MSRGLAKFLKPGGASIHAIDHVQRGPRAGHDMERIELRARLFGMEDVEPYATLQRLDRDPNTYVFSAAGVDWVSMQIVTSAERVARNLAAAGHP